MLAYKKSTTERIGCMSANIQITPPKPTAMVPENHEIEPIRSTAIAKQLEKFQDAEFVFKRIYPQHGRSATRKIKHYKYTLTFTHNGERRTIDCTIFDRNPQAALDRLKKRYQLHFEPFKIAPDAEPEPETQKPKWTHF